MKVMVEEGTDEEKVMVEDQEEEGGGSRREGRNLLFLNELTSLSFIAI